jgi:hypothetical protein
MTAVTIALVQVLYLVALYIPMGWRPLALPRGFRVGMGYLTANAIALCVGYSLDMLGCFSATLTFWVLLGIFSLLNLMCWRRVPPSNIQSRGRKYIYMLLVASMALTTWIRLADPVQNIALPGIDSYNFVNFYSWILNDQKAINGYPSGFALVTSIAPWRICPYQAVRWAPHFVFLSCLAASFGFWSRLGGLCFALILNFLLGTAWFLYPITAYHPHFIQWTMAFVGMPTLLLLYTRLARGEPIIPNLLLGISLNVVFAMTMGYFSLYINAVLLILTLISIPKRVAALKTAAAAACIALVPPLTLLGYYCIFNGISNQTQEVIAAVNQQTDSMKTSFMRNSPLAQVIFTFLLPADALHAGPRWGVYSGLILLGICILHWSRPARHTGARFLAGIVIFSAVSSMTGIFELPGWGGRNVFITLYTGLAAVLWTVIHRLPVMARRVMRSPWLLTLGIVTVAVPSLVWPPMIGRNVPIADVVQPRSIPVDNLVLRELTRPGNSPSGKKTLVIIHSRDLPSPLIRSLLAMSSQTRSNIFPAYRAVVTVDAVSIPAFDALLVADHRAADIHIPDDFTIRTRGPGYIFALREP